jgi:hypothetical protein
VGTYNNIEAEDKMRIKKISMFSKLDKKSFIDEYMARKKFVPGMGKYTNAENGYNKLSFGTSMRKRM